MDEQENIQITLKYRGWKACITNDDIEYAYKHLNMNLIEELCSALKDKDANKNIPYVELDYGKSENEIVRKWAPILNRINSPNYGVVTLMESQESWTEPKKCCNEIG
jgi:hypothetical protein